MAADTFPSLRPPAWPSRFIQIGLWFIGIGLVVAALSGPLTRFGAISFKIGLPLLGVGFLLLALGALLGIIGLIAGSTRRAALPKGVTAVAVLVALAALGYMLTWIRAGTGAPPIHEVSTDLATPPPFVDIRRIRDAIPGTNPSDYVAQVPFRGGAIDVPAAQRKAYPDLQPLHLDRAPDVAFSAAEAAARALGWEIVAAVPAEGRIEATATTRFFGFKDDIVVRLRPEQGGTRVDVRSKSRVGLGDAGANAARVRAYLALLRR